MSQKKKVFIVVVLLIGIAATAVYLIWNKPHKNVEAATAVEVSASDLYNLFTSDSLKAKNIYTGKVVMVSGQVAKISVNQQSENIILLKTAVAGAYINCTMEKNLQGVKENESVKIKGICSGYISGDVDMGLPGDVFLTRCYLFK